jgi:hypothetical protein
VAELKRRHQERLLRVRLPSPDRPKAEAVAEGAGEEVAEVDETSTKGDRLEVVDEEVHQAVVAIPRLLLLKSDRQAGPDEAGEEVAVEVEEEAQVDQATQLHQAAQAVRLVVTKPRPRMPLLKSDRQAAVVEAEEVVVEEGEAVVEEEDQARPRNDKQSPAKLEA